MTAETPETGQELFKALLPQSECLVFLETEPGYSPATGYQEYVRKRQAKGLHHPLFYASTTITSGGYRRDENIPIGEAIQNNSRLARQIIDEGFLVNGPSPELVLLPSELGKVSGWKQSDYLQLWLYAIRAVHPDSAKRLEDDWFNNPDTKFHDISERMEFAPSATERLEAYKEFVIQYLELKRDSVASQLLKANWQAPVVLPIFDNLMSLGCRAELFFSETVLPSWGFFPKSDYLLQTAAQFIARGALIAGFSIEDKKQADIYNEKALREYYTGSE